LAQLKACILLVFHTLLIRINDIKNSANALFF
jgi:hypothetical protein